MKLTVDLSALLANVKKMGAPERALIDLERPVSPGIDIDGELSKRGGHEILPSELDIEEGLLSYSGRQVLLFLPNHRQRIEGALAKPTSGNKYHVADCQHLEKMRANNQFNNNYVVTNNVEGIFDIYGQANNGEKLEGSAALNVCQFCLSKLNYKNAANESFSGRKQIATTFGLNEFFSNYSSLFKHYPLKSANEALQGYTSDWSDISKRIRAAANYCCKHCDVSLDTDKGLLHTHHISGDKSDNSASNLIPLCADCHRKQPYHGHMQVKHEDIKAINHLRRSQNLIECDGWADAFKYADPACHGILHHCQTQGLYVPEVGYEMVNNIGQVVAEFELAWPNENRAVVLRDAPAIEGWHLMSLSEATAFFDKSTKR